MDADVVLQAGHQGQVRNKGSMGTAPSHGTSGITTPEHLMTPVVADEAAEILARHGVEVLRVSALFPKKVSAKLGLALHFDGSGTRCASGASVGYPPGKPRGSNKPTADLWKEIYGSIWPFKWMSDNFSKNLSGYYGYGWMSTEIAEMLIEFGEITCEDQNAWIEPRLEWLGGVVAHFVGRVLGVPVPEPAPFGTAPPTPLTTHISQPWDDDIADLRLEIAELRRDVATLTGSTSETERSIDSPGPLPELEDLDHEEW
jgi:hypothetical protein